MKRFLGSQILLVGLAATAFAQSAIKTFQLTVPQGSTYAYSIQRPLDQKEPIPLEGSAAELASPDDPNGYTVYVTDLQTNRAAAKPLVDVLKAKSWKVAATEFKLVAGIRVNLEPRSKTISAGKLTLSSGEKGEDRLISASSQNQAFFRYWPDPRIRARLEYDVDGDLKQVELSTTIPTSPYPYELTLKTLESEEPVAAAEKSSAPAESVRPSGDQKPAGASFFQLLVGLAVIAGLGYLAYWYYKNNQQVVERLAKQAGLDPGQNSDPTGSMPSEPEPHKLQPIDLGASAAPTSVAGAASATPAVSIARNPRLVNNAGEVFLIPSGETTIGREGQIAIAAESSVSRIHARASRSGDEVTIEDAGSTNGTYVNGTKVGSAHVLQAGDTVQFGAAQFRYEV